MPYRRSTSARSNRSTGSRRSARRRSYGRTVYVQRPYYPSRRMTVAPKPEKRSQSEILGAQIGKTADMLGKQLGGVYAQVKQLFGSGDYRIGTAPAVNSLFVGSKPSNDINAGFGSKTVRIQHREYLTDVLTASSPNTFKIETYSLNPGLFKTFPWLYAIASDFQCYKLHGCIVEFKTTSADALNSVNTALGTVVLAADYDSVSGPFVSKQDMLNSFGAIDAKPSQSCMMGIECDPKRIPLSELYVRNGPTPSQADPRMYDVCNFSVATTGMQGTSVNVGELYIVYDIEFYMPIMNTVGSTIPMAMYRLSDVTLTGNPGSGPGIFGTNPQAVFDNIGLVFPTPAIIGQAYASLPYNPNWNGTQWVVSWKCTGDSTALVAAPTPLSVGGTDIPAAWPGLAGADRFVNANQNGNATATDCGTTFFVHIGEMDPTNPLNFFGLQDPAGADIIPTNASGVLYVSMINATSLPTF